MSSTAVPYLDILSVRSILTPSIAQNIHSMKTATLARRPNVLDDHSVTQSTQ